MSNILQFDRSRLRVKNQPWISVTYKQLKFDNTLKAALEFIQDVPFQAPKDIEGLSEEIIRELILWGVLDLNLQCIPTNPYGFNSCPYCGRIGDKLDLDECCDEAMAGGFTD